MVLCRPKADNRVNHAVLCSIYTVIAGIVHGGPSCMNDIERGQRRKLVRQAMWITRDTPLAPSWHERQLLAKYVQGALTIEQVIALVEEEQSY
jgi:hypothetical protein